MEASGLVDVQSHTKTHTWHFATDVIVDFHHPTDEYYWLDWNRSPGDKPTWLNRDVRAAVPWGRPVYEHAQTLLRKRYHDDPAIVERTTAHVRDHGGADFFQPPGWRTELFRVVAEHRRGDGVQGRYETDAEYADRVRGRDDREQADSGGEPRNAGKVSVLAVWRLHAHATAVGDRGLRVRGDRQLRQDDEPRR